MNDGLIRSIVDELVSHKWNKKGLKLLKLKATSSNTFQNSGFSFFFFSNCISYI